MINKTFNMERHQMDLTTQLLEAALLAQKKAYVPYSGFPVGAAILADDNKIYTGCNVENISYPCGSCAEQGAISAMICGGGRQIKEILILGNGQNLITPCGACRQRIAEFSKPQTLIHLATTQGIQKTLTLTELLPLAFFDESLKHD